MTLHIVIDGYNLIRQSKELAEIDRRDMQAGREALLLKLAAYRKIKPYRITVVFDGSYAKGVYPARDNYKGVTALYSAGGDSADDVIKNMAVKEQNLLVVSSDNAVAAFCRLHNAAVIESPAFEMRMEMAAAFGADTGPADEDAAAWDGSTRKKGPSYRQPKAKRRQKNIYKKL